MANESECRTCVRTGKTCLLCQGDLARIAERLAGHFRPRAEECSDGRGGTRPSWYQGGRGGDGRGRREAPAQHERTVDTTTRVSPRGLS